MRAGTDHRDPPTIAVLGQGSIGRRHAANLLELGCDVVAFDPISPDFAPGIGRAASVDDALARADAAVVASPTSEHLAHVCTALEHDCHVLVEKPLAVALDGVDQVVELAAAKGLLLAVAMNLRFHPGPRVMKHILEAGTVGRPLTAHFTFGYHLPSWRPGVDYRERYSARAALGGGVLLDAIHEIDYASWLLGPIAEVSGWADRVSDLALDVEDSAWAIAHFESRAIGSFTLDYLDRSYRRGCRIVGEEGSIRWSWRDESVEVLRPGGRVEPCAVPSAVDDSYRDEARAFVDALAAGRKSTDGTGLVSATEGRAALAVVEAIRRSGAEGGRVTAVASPP